MRRLAVSVTLSAVTLATHSRAQTPAEILATHAVPQAMQTIKAIRFTHTF